MNLYPDQLRNIADLIEALNVVDQSPERDITQGVMLGSGIKVLDSDGASTLGYLVDEIGGAWSFRAATYVGAA